MTQKKNDISPGFKLLSMYAILLHDHKLHYQADFANILQCSPQTILRLAHEIELFVGEHFESGIENRKRWYRISSASRKQFDTS